MGQLKSTFWSLNLERKYCLIIIANYMRLLQIKGRRKGFHSIKYKTTYYIKKAVKSLLLFYIDKNSKILLTIYKHRLQ